MKILKLLLVFVVTFSFVGPASAATYSIGTNPQGSLFYSSGMAISMVMVQKTGAQYRIAPYGGSSTYIPLIGKGELEFGLINSGESAFAYDGTEIFKGTPDRNLRMVAAFYKNYAGIGVEAKSQYKTVADLKGKRIPSDFPSGRIFSYLNEAILATANLRYEDFKKVPVPNYVDGVDLLIQGRVDGAFIPMNSAIGKKAMASISGGWRFVNFPASEAAEVKASAIYPPSRIELLKPQKEFEGIVDDPTSMLVIDFFIISSTHVPDDVVYRLVKTMYENKAELAKSFGAVFNSFEPEGMAAKHPVPYHPGAVKFYKEVGIWKGGS